MFDKSMFKIKLNRPSSDNINKIVLTDNNNFKYYVFWKIFYEELSEEFLMHEYDIRKPIKVNNLFTNISEIIHSSSPEKDNKFNIFENKKLGFKKKNTFYDIIHHAMLEKNIIHSNNDFEIIDEKKEKIQIKSNKKFYIPIAVCIKTYIEDEYPIIDFLKIQFNYFEDTFHNYRDTNLKDELFLKLASNIFFSMFIIKPPIFSTFYIYIGLFNR